MLLLLSSTLPLTSFTSPLPHPSSSLSGKSTSPRTRLPLSPGPLAPARAPDSPHTHPALLGPRSRLPPARLHTTPRTRTLYTTLPKRFTPRPGLAHPHVTAITLYTTARPSTSPRHGDHVHTTHVPSVRVAHSATPDSDGQDHRPFPTPHPAQRHGGRPARPNSHRGSFPARVPLARHLWTC